MTMASMSSPKARSYARPWRWAKTLFFVAAMLASLLLDCAPPLLVVLLDLLLPPTLLSAAAATAAAASASSDYSSLSASTLSQQIKSFHFRSSLVDVPIVSAIRSILILCAFLFCGGNRGLNKYLGVATLCSSASIVYLFVKQLCMLPVTAGKYAAAIQALFVASFALAAAHVVAAYRISCRERRKMLVYRIDVEAVKVKGGLIKGDNKQ